MARHTQLKAQSPSGDNFQLTAHETDSPILPVPQLEQLHSFRPDLVDWVKDQTQAEAEHRRRREGRVDNFIFVERLGGLVLGALIALAGLGIAAYVGLNGQPQVAMVLGGGTLATIVSVIVTGRRSKQPPQPEPQDSSKASSKGKKA